jgi:mannose-6-phosphate isomerase-like protein (cupin superfamily)
MRYENSVVKKPWGYEYLAYENDECALWFLHINHDQRTSMHCHPNKTTGLVVLDGEAEVSFLSDKNPLKPISKIMIRKGLFHSTRAVAPEGAAVFEIETPVDKYDLVRLRDSYGREGKPYEDSTHEYPKQEDCLWIENPSAGEENVYNFSNCRLRVVNVPDTNFFLQVGDDKNIMFLQGGIQAEYGTRVAGAGDIITGNIAKQLIQVFDKVKDDTIIMLMEVDNE